MLNFWIRVSVPRAEGIGANAPRRGVVPTALPADEITLEGHTLKILGPMQGDHVHCTALWDPDTRTLVAGDLVYNGAFVFLGEHLAPQYAEWLASLDYPESLDPVRVIAGHTKPGLPDDSFAIDWTRGYIRAFAKAAKIAKSSREMAAMIHALYPNAVNFPGTEFLIRDMLAPTDYEITETENGEEALAAIRLAEKLS